MNKISSAESSRLTVTYRLLGDLIPDPRNARTHPKRQIDQIRASIEAFGFTNPVLADPDDEVIPPVSAMSLEATALTRPFWDLYCAVA